MLERRRSGWASDSPLAEPRQTPARLVLEQYPVPAIALADDGAVLFANTAFAAILGCSCDAVTSMSYEDIFSALPTGETLFAVARLRADTIGNLLHLGGSTFFAKMSKSAIMLGADLFAIATFEELMARLLALAEP
jgi:PAS domain S-box-containing protein